MADWNGKKILIVSMTTWGEMGNWLSGKSLGATIGAALAGSEVSVEPAETLIPLFADTGRRIKEATLGSATPEERFARYSQVLRELERTLPPGFENREDNADLQPLVNRLKADTPDVVIGTKGVICRMLQAALRAAGLRRPVVNYVTNHGHFQFPVHRVEGAAMHLVRFPEGVAFLESACGWPRESMRTVGYLIAAHQLGSIAAPSEPAAGDGTPRQSLVIVSNRGGKEYLDLLSALSAEARHVTVTFIGINDDELCAGAQAIINDAGLDWRVVSSLSQKELFQLMLQARRRGVCSLVCKASPNSIFEAIYFGLPMFLLRTGLPMEEWGAEIVIRGRLGTVAESMPDLIPEITQALREESLLAAMQKRQAEFARMYLDQRASVKAIVTALDEVMGA